MTKNPQLIPGVATLSRSAAYKAKGLFHRKKASPAKTEPKPTTVVKPIGGAKNGKTRTVSLVKTSKFYPAEDAPVPRLSRKVNRPSTTRASITPGTVLILIAGRFAGKRVVYLKTLPSGLLLVTGPFKINGVPLRRVNQAYAIATSAKVDVSKVVVPEIVNDAAFKATREVKQKATEAALFDIAAKRPVAEERVAAQKAVDAAILAEVKKTPLLKAYLNASFSLTKGQKPHLMKF
ncbi:60S ribosomal protein L6 [Rhizoclosmatium globosum]|uniref:60S ribosomal protein L6 n=1 Tax=Rhizoclosmatium globosum TaxID=329046 RepID=A0A1Y2B372_9FUNG|nr:60S ribosomal protein L6 [Rhizoclosmatium globosum]|eukprot:ORY29271.1 60S ribosomal protein L6 [Rhizoclosmatium globosum]